MTEFSSEELDIISDLLKKRCDKLTPVTKKYKESKSLFYKVVRKKSEQLVSQNSNLMTKYELQEKELMVKSIKNKLDCVLDFCDKDPITDMTLNNYIINISLWKAEGKYLRELTLQIEKAYDTIKKQAFDIATLEHNLNKLMK